MTENNTDSDKLDLEGLKALIGFGLLAYGVYKLFSSKGSDLPSKKCLTYRIIEKIVNGSFRSLSEIDMQKMIFYYALPNVFTGKIKEDIYVQMMYDRLKNIHDNILVLKDEYEGYYPTYSERDIYDLISYIKNDCYKQIKTAKLITNLKGEILKNIPGLGVVGKFMDAKTEYCLLNSINKSLIEYFVCLYVDGKDSHEAKKILMRRYVESFRYYADQATDGLSSAVSNIF